MSFAKVNIAAVELGEPLDEAGFRHVATTVGPRVGARRIGASVYEAEPEVPIWPYHYHHGIEEWLYVIAGAPVVREPAGSRVLAPGDLVCFPSGHRGAHAVSGPGRFVIFSANHQDAPYLSVYPDSDKVSGPGGIYVRSSAVGYWHGEGTGGPAEPAPTAREPARSAPRPVIDVLAVPAPAELGAVLGAHRLDATVVELEPGQAPEPYRCVFGRETWLLVLRGAPAVRRPGGEQALEAGDLACFPDGPEGTHQLLNRGTSPVRALVLTTTGLPANVHHPDTGQWVLHHEP